LLTVLANLPAVREQNVTACNALMAGIAKEYRQYVDLGAVEPNGVRFCGGDSILADSINFPESHWFHKTLQTRDFTIGNYQVARGSGPYPAVRRVQFLGRQGGIRDRASHTEHP